MSQPMKAEPVQDALEAWLASVGFQLREARPLSGDVSPRRYARLVREDGSTAILATYPPEVRSVCPRFLHTTGLLTRAGVPVPKVLASDCDEGWMLVEDLGLQTLGEWGQGRPWSELTPWFERGLDLAGRIARLPAEGLADLNPRLGRELLRKELAQTWDLFLEPRGLTGDAGDAATTRELSGVLDALCDALGAETPVPCHRDFMVRNLMPLPGGDLVVLDHQDLRFGPPAYDLASLLNDTLFPPAEVEEALLAKALAGTGIERVQYHRAAAQRTLKAVGTYASFARRGADRHLPLVPPTLSRFLDHLARVPEGAGLAGDLARIWAPVLGPVGV